MKAYFSVLLALYFSGAPLRMAQQENSLCKMYVFLQLLALYWKFVHDCVCCSLPYLVFFALQQKCMGPLYAFAFSVDLLQLYVAPWLSTGAVLHVLVCSTAEVP